MCGASRYIHTGSFISCWILSHAKYGRYSRAGLHQYICDLQKQLDYPVCNIGNLRFSFDELEQSVEAYP